MVAVPVGEGDPRDRAAGRLGGADEVISRTRHPGIDERKPIVFTHEIGVDEPEPGELGEGVGDGGLAHRVPFAADR